MTSRKKCWVPTCANIAGRDNKKYSFLPGNSQMRELWIAVSGKTTESIPAEDILFCEEHFPEEDILKCKTSLVPCKNMPDRMCRTCMCIIPAENSFHVISSKFTSEMPPSIKDTLFFWITSKPEPLQQIFSFCIPELKIPRDPIQIICNDCFHNIWLFFVFKITCIEVEKDLKGDMSWANYGKKVLCRSCIQTSGTNFIPLTAQSNMGNLLQKMFVNDCPPPEIVPLQVCLICFNVLEKLDHFYKNCLEVEEKMSRHIALKKKYEHRDMKELPSTTIQKFLPIQHINNCPPHYANESMNYSNLPKNYVASIPNNKQILAQLMLRYGLPLRKDLYQQEVWSLICQKMQEQSIACNVPGLMNVWKEMEKETKRKFELKERPQYIDKLVMEFYNIVPSYTNTESLREYHISKSVDKGNATSIIQGITISKNRVENLIQEEDNEKEIPLLVEETDDNQNKKVLPTKSDSSSKATSKTDDKTFSHHQRSWTDEKKMEFLKVIEDEYKIHSSTRKQSEISLARGPWRSICFRLAEHRYKEYEGLFLYQMWIAIKKRAIEEENQETVSPVSKMALTMLNAELAICKKLGRNVSTKRVLKSSLHTVLDRKDELNITGSGNSKKKQAEFKKITRNSVKNAEGSKKNVKDDCVMKNPEEPEEKPIKETATPPDYDQSTVVAIKKRSSKEIPSSSKKPRTAHRSFSEEEKLQLVKLISDVYENMPKDELLGIASWPAVIKRIIENGGFKDYTGDEIDSVWCQMRLTASRRKHIGSSGALDNKVYKLMALAAKNRAYTRMKSKKNTTPSKKQYEKDRAYCPNRFLNVGTGNINKSSVELRHEIKSHHPKVTLEDYEIEDETTERNSPGRNWSRSEKIGLISAVRSHGNIFKQNQDHLWLKIHQEYEEKGFKRPLATIKTYWYSLLKHAEMVWANQKERNEIDNILISFMENSTNVLNNISETNTTDGDNPVNNLDEEEEKASCIDLTYDYVSFKDIEKLAWETAEVKTPLKTEQKEKEDDEETIIDFVMAKVEGGVQYDSGDSVQDESVPESTELLDSSTCQEKGDTQEKRDKSEDRVENEETPKKTSAPVDEVSEESNSLQKNVKKEKRTLAESDEIIEINSDSE
ncbi:hypothetical protein JTB14_028498 [Gonioctena quinquepunctata]|nr:hypothetical protein JTB14_028498 [Gonioctena quinquepunctata]